MTYKVIVDDKYDVTKLVETITLKDSLDQIAYQANIRLAVSASSRSACDFTGHGGADQRGSFGEKSMVYLLHPAVIWEAESANSGTKRLSLTVYDRMIYLEKSEDEFLFPRIRRQYNGSKLTLRNGKSPWLRVARDQASWVRRVSVTDDFSMIFADLKETAKSGETCTTHA